MKSAITISLVEETKGGPFVFWGDPVKAIEQAKSLGFDAVEIFPSDANSLQHCFLEKTLAENGIAVAAVGTGAGWVKHRLQLADEDELVRNRAIDFIRSIIDVAAEFGAPAIIGSMQGRSSPAVEKRLAKQYLRDALSTLSLHANQYGIPILYEPLNRYETDQANTLSEAMDIIEGLGNVRLLADWFHMNIEEVNMAESIKRAGRAIGHIHFADSNRMAVGNGHLEVPPIMEALRNIGYAGYLSAEIYSKPDAMSAAKTTIESYQKAICM